MVCTQCTISKRAIFHINLNLNIVNVGNLHFGVINLGNIVKKFKRILFLTVKLLQLNHLIHRLLGLYFYLRPTKLGYPNGHFSVGIPSSRRSRDLSNLLSKQAIFLRECCGSFFYFSMVTGTYNIGLKKR